MAKSPRDDMRTKKAGLKSPWSNEMRDIADRLATRSNCDRCGGLLVVDHYVDLLDDQGRQSCSAMRCLQCGDLVDPVILKNRQQVQAKQRELAGVA